MRKDQRGKTGRKGLNVRMDNKRVFIQEDKNERKQLTEKEITMVKKENKEIKKIL